MLVAELVRSEPSTDPARAPSRRSSARASVCDQARPRVAPPMTQKNGPTGISKRERLHGSTCSHAHSSIPTSRRLPPFPCRTRNRAQRHAPPRDCAPTHSPLWRTSRQVAQRQGNTTSQLCSQMSVSPQRDLPAPIAGARRPAAASAGGRGRQQAFEERQPLAGVGGCAGPASACQRWLVLVL